MNNVEILKKDDIKSYINFMKETFGYESNNELIEKLMDKEVVLIIKENNNVVASTILVERMEYIKNKKYYHIDYFGVLPDYRRKGYASKLFKKIEEMVKLNNIDYLELTSGNQRTNAHEFYKAKGFKIKDTSVFIKNYQF